jgi:uncharacterized protein YhjY with autotransporter beta-barrel domain
VIDTDTVGPVNIVSREELELRHNVDITSALQGVIGAGQNAVTVAPGASIDAGTTGIQLLDGGVVDNAGSISGGTFGIDAVESIQVLNSGSITGGTFGIRTGGSLNLVTRGRIEGGAFGVSAAENAQVWNDGKIHGGTFGISTGGDLWLWNRGEVGGGDFGIAAGGNGYLWNWGSIDGGDFGISLSGDLNLRNWGQIRGGNFGVTSGGAANVWNWGRIEGGDFGLSTSGALHLYNWGRIAGGDFGATAGGHVRAWNWGEIEGGDFGLAVSRNLELWNWGRIEGGQFGVSAPGEHTVLRNFGRITGGQFAFITDSRAPVVTNFATIDSPGTGIRFAGGSPLLVNHGFVGGGRTAVELGGGGDGVLRLSGTGFYRGDVVGSPGDGDTLRLDLVGVPLEVKQSLLGREGALGGPLAIPAFGIFARDFERLQIDRLVSFQEEFGGDFGGFGRALDWRRIAKDGPETAFVQGFAGLLDDRRGLDDALENVSGRSTSHSASDMAFANTWFWNQDLAHYLDLKRDKAWADQKEGIEATRFGGFAKGTGIFADQDRTSHRANGDWTVSGAYVGGDYTTGRRVTLGAFGGYTRSEADVDDFGSTLSSDDVHGGLYGGCMHGPVAIDGAAWYSRHDYDAKRRLDLPGFSQRSQADFDADQLSTYLRASYAWRPGIDERLEIAPRLMLSYSHAWLGGWREQSSVPALALDLDDQEADSLRTGLGARVSGRFGIGKLTLQPELRADWMHEYLDDGRRIRGRFATGAFDGFATESEVDGRDSAVIGAGVTLHLPVCDCMQKVELYAGWDAQLGRDGFQANVANLQLKYDF